MTSTCRLLWRSDIGALIVALSMSFPSSICWGQGWKPAVGPGAAAQFVFGEDQLLFALAGESGQEEYYYTSTDCGNEWSKQGAGVYVDGTVAHQSKGIVTGGRVYAGVWYEWFGSRQGGVYVSDDSAKSWRIHSLEGLPIVAIKPLGAAGMVALAESIEGRRWYVRDAGTADWRPFGKLDERGSHITSLANGLAATASGAIVVIEGGGLYVSMDSARTWKLRRESSEGGIVGAGANGVFVHIGESFNFTMDAGLSWTSTTVPWQDSFSPTEIVIREDAAVWVIGSGRQVWMRSATGKWVSADLPGRTNDITHTCRAVIVATESGLFQQHDSDASWLAIGGGLPRATVGSFARWGDNVVLAAPLCSTCSSTDGGEVWTGASIELLEFPRGVRPSHLAAAQGNVFGLFPSVGLAVLDSGATAFRPILLGTLPNGECDCGVLNMTATSQEWLFVRTANAMYRLSADGVDRGVVNQKLWFNDVIAADDDHFVAAVRSSGPVGLEGWSEAGLYWSTDDGASWQRRSGVASYYALAAFEDGTVVAATDGELQTWTADGRFVESTAIPISWESPAINIITHGPSTVFLAINDAVGALPSEWRGVVHSTDRGRSWSPVNDGLDAHETISALYVYAPGRLLASTAQGIYHRSPISSISDVTRDEWGGHTWYDASRDEIVVEYSSVPISGFRLVNLVGEAVLGSPIEDTRVVTSFELCTAQLPNGVYLLVLYSAGNRVKTHRVRIVR